MPHPALKLHYFAIPGLAETSRLILTVGDVPFENITYTFETFPAFKATTPFGQVPVLEVDGKPLAQSGAIERYCARLAGLMPSDPWHAAQADQVSFLLRDIQDVLTPTYRIADLDEKFAARKKIVDEVFPVRLGALVKVLEANGGQHFVGDSLTYADLAVFVMTSTLISGQLDGVPRDLLDSYPVLKAFRHAIASLPAVKAYYAPHTEGIRAAFRPDSA